MNCNNVINESRTEQDCAVCLQKCQHPTQLPCGHVFCFLCVKGVAFQSRKCAMCRADIPLDYLDNPVLLEDVSSAQPIDDDDDLNQKYQWYYEGRNGWWKYDERSNNELESAFSAGESSCTLLLAGALYIVDFQALTQVRRSDQTRKRRVKRDTPQFPAKGIAGIKTEKRQEEDINDDENSNTNNECQTVDVIFNIDTLSSVPESQVISENGEVNYVMEIFGVIHLDDDDDSTSETTENI